MTPSLDPSKPSPLLLPINPGPRQVNPASNHFDPQPKATREPAHSQTATGKEQEREKEVEKDVHGLTYVLSIEIALTVTVLCREASREKRGKHRVRDLEEESIKEL